MRLIATAAGILGLFVLAVGQTGPALAADEEMVVGGIKYACTGVGEESRQEAGVITYTTHVDPDDPREFFIYEKYHDADGLAAHQETTHFRELVLEKAIPLLESRVRRQFADF